jgi:energy-coupling factor transporter ATP-binding protein EcfA2
VKELVSLSAGIKEAKELAAESGLKEKCLTTIDHIKSGIKDRVTSAEFENLYQEIFNLYNDSHAKTSAIHPRLAQANAEFENVYNIFNRPAPTAVEGAWEAIKPRLPVFLYYSNYGNLDSEIYLPHVVDNLTRTGLGAKEAAKARTLKVLFSFVGLDPKEILELGRDFKDPADPNRKPTEAEIEAINKKKKERSILLQSAGTKLTSKFKDWWKQGDYRFRFEADGDHFRIWVSDDRRPEEVELEGRSTGLQWFLSFYLVFLVESEGEHKDAFLLLDEPGLSLHPLAQKNLSSFFVNLATTNQIIFTTHSPFLVDADNLDQARKVYVSENGSTKATGNLNEGESRKSQPGASYALSSALNLHVAESLLIGCEPVIVEGPSDQYILSAIKTLLIGAGRIAPPKELVFPPSGGAKSVKVISSILLGRDDQLPIVLLDDDTVGRSAAKELKQELYKGVEKRILNIAEYVGFEGAEIEDIVPPDLFVAVVDREIRLENSFEDVHKASSPIVPQIEKWAASSGHTLEKGWKVPLAIAVKRKLLSQEIKKLDGKQVDDWGRLFDDFFERKQD